MAAIRSDAELRLHTLVTGMHLAPQFGSTWRQIEADGFSIEARIESQLAGDTGISTAKSVSLGISGFADLLERLRPDWLLVLGDRYEMLASVIAALFLRIPVAHIAGGDMTEGAYDDAIRHAVTKMAQIHFTTNPAATRRLRQMGEDPTRIHQVGSPALDLLHTLPRLDRETLAATIGFRFRTKNLLVTFHPVTLDRRPPQEQIAALLEALDDLGEEHGILFTYPNADDGGGAIIAAIERFVRDRPHCSAVPSLGQQRYYSLLAQVDAVVGNSSSGLYEAPSFAIPTVNIGRRQEGRLKAASVIDCEPDRAAIHAAILRAFALDCSGVINPYGDGHSAPRIVAALKAVTDPASLIRKPFFDLPL